MTKTVSLDELTLHDKDFYAEVEVDIDAHGDEWAVSELVAWLNNGNIPVYANVNKLDPRLEKEIIEIAKAQFIDSGEWPSDQELKEEAYERHYGI